MPIDVHRAVFKGGGYGFKPSPPEMLRRKFLAVKKHAQRNASADALYVCTTVMPGKAVRRLQIQETAWAAEAPPRTPLGEHTAPPDP